MSPFLFSSGSQSTGRGSRFVPELRSEQRLGQQALAMLFVIVMLAGIGSSANAQQSGPREPTTTMQKMNPVNWKMPSFRLPNFMVPQDEQTRIVKRKDGLVTDVKDTASRSWKRTKEVFNPARYNPMNLFAAGPEETQRPTSEDKPGFFSSMFGPPHNEPVERVATVNEFLSQDRP